MSGRKRSRSDASGGGRRVRQRPTINRKRARSPDDDEGFQREVRPRIFDSPFISTRFLAPTREYVTRGAYMTTRYYEYQVADTSIQDAWDLIVRCGDELVERASLLLTNFPVNTTMTVYIEVAESMRMLGNLRSRYGRDFGIPRTFSSVTEIRQHLPSDFGDMFANLYQSDRQTSIDDVNITLMFRIPRNAGLAFGKMKKLRNFNSDVTKGLAAYDVVEPPFCGYFAVIYAMCRSQELLNNWTGSINWFTGCFSRHPDRRVEDIKQSKKRWVSLCKLLAQNIGANVDCGWDMDVTSPYNTAKLFVKYQPKMQIVIFNEVTRNIMDNQKGSLFDYKYVDQSKTNTIFLSYTTGHLHLITSISKYLGHKSQYFCCNCLKLYRDKKHPCRQTAQCDRCMLPFANAEHETTHCKVGKLGLYDCTKCEKQFYNEQCLRLHKCPNFKKMHRCEVCDRNVYKYVEHDCKKHKCIFCSKLVDTDHVCYMEKLSDSTSLSASQCGKDYYAFDLETMTINSSGTQQVNLVCVTRCFSNDQWKFTNLTDFISWAEKLEGDDICLFAHNLKGFDGRIVFDYLFDRSTAPQNVLWAGNKLMTMTYGKIKFRDTLLHIPAPLEQLPKMFGLDESKFKKGFFPHKFNLPENQNYVGQIPDKKYYAPENMKKSKLVEFEKWYDLVKNEQFDFQKELYEYCLSDTLILARAIEAYMEKQMAMKPLNPWSKLTIASYAMAIYRNYFMPENKIARLNKKASDDIRRSMHGGRTDTRRMLKEWTPQEVDAGYYGKYQDVQSLYPTVQFYDPLPVGIPKYKFYKDDNQPSTETIKQFFGFVCVDIEPTQYLFHPVIVDYDDDSGKLLAGLHPLKDVVIASPELKLAIEHGYVVKKVYWSYEFESSTELFKNYFREFLHKKLVASGKPKWVVTDEHKKEFELYHKQTLGIDIDVDEMQKNNAMKTGAKLLCNSLWGKFGERVRRNVCKTFKLGQHDDEVIEMESGWIDGSLNVSTRRLTTDNQHVMFVYNNIDDEINHKLQGPHARNIAIASMITSHARCRLWKEMNKLGDRVLYHDTDSIIYEHQPNQYNIPEGRFLGEWECETAGVPIIKFTSTGPKSYSYITNEGECVTKVKGITLNSENSGLINYETMKKIATFESDEIKASALNFSYDREKGKMKIGSLVKVFKNTYEKGFIDKNTWKVYPFGWTRFHQSLPGLGHMPSIRCQ
jgi:hypothetical protein